MRGATQGTAEAKEDLNGVPGPRGVSGGLVWLEAASGRLVKAQLDVPTTPGQPGGPTASVTVTLSDLDAPVTIMPPS